MLKIDEDDILVGSPRSKFFDLVFNANKNIVKDTLEIKIEEYIAMEMLLAEEYGKDYYVKIKQKIDSNTAQIENFKNNFFMDFASTILSQHE